MGGLCLPEHSWLSGASGKTVATSSPSCAEGLLMPLRMTVSVGVWGSEVNFGCHYLIFFSDLLNLCQCFACIYVCAACVGLVRLVVRRGADHMELELQTVMSCCVGSGNQTWDFCKSKQPVFLTTVPSLCSLAISSLLRRGLSFSWGSLVRLGRLVSAGIFMLLLSPFSVLGSRVRYSP